LSKKDKTASYWPRLIEEKIKTNHISLDWSKYVDEDDEEGESAKGMNDWNPEMMKSTFLIIDYNAP
jgi:hypothetical protein